MKSFLEFMAWLFWAITVVAMTIGIGQVIVNTGVRYVATSVLIAVASFSLRELLLRRLGK